MTEELLQLALLAVRQRVHRVDDDRLDATAGAWRRTWSTIGTM